MSTYPFAEAALLTLVRTYASGATFTTANSAADDWAVLDAPNTEVAAVVEMVGPTTEGVEQDGYGVDGEYQETHTIALWVCVKRGTGDGGDGAVKQALKTLTEALKDYLRPYRRLGTAEDDEASVIRSARMTRTTEPSYISPTDKVEDATHVAQMITLQVLCESAAPDGEMDG